MNKEAEKILDDQFKFITENGFIDQDTKYAKHFKEVLKQLA